MPESPILAMALATAPIMITVLVGILVNNARMTDLRNHVDTRFDEMRSSWTSELRRVEEVLDARLKHLEER